MPMLSEDPRGVQAMNETRGTWMIYYTISNPNGGVINGFDIGSGWDQWEAAETVKVKALSTYHLSSNCIFTVTGAVKVA